MSVANDLERLSQLHRDGELSHEEYSRAKARVLSGVSPAAHLASGVNRLARSRGERWLGGVCGGLAQVSGLAPWLWRLMFVLLVPFGGSGVLVYALLWIFLPLEVPAGRPAIELGQAP